MAEEAEVEIDEVLVEDISEEISEVSYVEEFDPENPTQSQKMALDAGWKPEGVDGKDALTSKEFNGRQPLYDQLHGLKQQLKKQSKAIDMLVQQNGNIAEQARQKAIRDLTERKIEAIENADKDEVLAIDGEIAELSKPVVQDEDFSIDDVKEVMESYTQEWTSRNTWYNDPDQKEYADYLMYQYMAKNSYGPAKSEEELVQRLDKAFSYLEDKMKERSSEKPKPRASAVQSSSRKPVAAKKTYTINDIKDPAIRQVADTIKRQNGPVEAYIKNLEKSGHFDK